MLSKTKPKEAGTSPKTVLKEKTCRVCKTKFTPARPLQIVCSIRCGMEIARKRRQRSVIVATRAAKEAAKSRRDWVQDAQTVFNKWIRIRDDGLPCISCGCVNAVQWHSGHFRSTKAAPELRFHPDNVHKQCSSCNNYLSGNLLEYRIRLVKRIGLAKVEWLEGPHEPKKWTIDELQAIKTDYQGRIKDANNRTG